MESGDKTIVGVNSYQAQEPAPPIFQAEPAARVEVLADLEAVRSERDGEAVAASLEQVRVAAGGNANLMPPLLTAVEAYATVGEICATLEGEFGRYHPPEVL